MFCDRCGNQIDANQNFCPSCGKPIRAVPVVRAAKSRVSTHLTLLAIFWFAISAMRLIGGLTIVAIFRPSGMDFFPPEVPFFVHNLLEMIGIMLVFGAVVGIVAAWGLLEHQSWARVLTIVLACVSLLEFPFGTALGVYTLWVLLPADAAREFVEPAQAA